MKKEARVFLLVTYFFYFFSFLHSVQADFTQNETFLRVGQPIKFAGKTITLINLNARGDLHVDVDQRKGLVPEYGPYIINGVTFIVNQVFDAAEPEYRLAIVNLTIQYICGNGNCDGEGAEADVCCTDCGCTLNRICINNYCQVKEENQSKGCETNSDCPLNATEVCTAVKCLNFQCVYTQNETCLNFGKCKVDTDCTDENACTTDSCTNKNCTYTQQQGCIFENQCVPDETVKNNEYCLNTGWSPQKKQFTSCTENYECLTNSCMAKRCMPQIKKDSVFLWGIILIILIAVIVFIRINAKPRIEVEP